MNDRFTIHLGALAEPIQIQLEKQGFRLSDKKSKYYSDLSDYITTLKFADILTDSECDKCRKKLFNKMKKDIANIN